jgi:signal transduction histidine kinase
MELGILPDIDWEISEFVPARAPGRMNRSEMLRSLTHPPPHRAWRLFDARYLMAIAIIGAAVLVADWVQPLIDGDVLLLVGVVLAAWFSGLWPAMVAAVLATLALERFFAEPYYTVGGGLTTIPRLAVFMGIAALFAAAGAQRRRAERALKQVLDELDGKVRERTVDLTRANEQLGELAGRLIDAQEQERSRIGRELHDHISQTLGVLTIRLDQLRADAATPPLLAESLTALRESARDITQDIHDLSHRLHSSALDYLGLVPALQRLVAEVSSRHDVVIEFTHGGLPASLPSDVALCLFRVTEEGLTNIVKHSHAKLARVDARGAADGIHLTIEDTGDGFDTGILEHRAGLGFVSMRERLRVLGGRVSVTSVPERGTTIEVLVPATRLATAATPAGAVTSPAGAVSSPSSDVVRARL